MDQCKFISMTRKCDGKEVYSSPAYFLDESSEALDWKKIFNNLTYFIDRVNSGIQQQLESNRLSDEQKSSLNLISKSDFNVSFNMLFNDGGWRKKMFWTKSMDSIS